MSDSGTARLHTRADARSSLPCVLLHFSSQDLQTLEHQPLAYQFMWSPPQPPTLPALRERTSHLHSTPLSASSSASRRHLVCCDSLVWRAAIGRAQLKCRPVCHIPPCCVFARACIARRRRDDEAAHAHRAWHAPTAIPWSFFAQTSIAVFDALLTRHLCMSSNKRR